MQDTAQDTVQGETVIPADTMGMVPPTAAGAEGLAAQDMPAIIPAQQTSTISPVKQVSPAAPAQARLAANISPRPVAEIISIEETQAKLDDLDDNIKTLEMDGYAVLSRKDLIHLIEMKETRTDLVRKVGQQQLDALSKDIAEREDVLTIEKGKLEEKLANFKKLIED